MSHECKPLVFDYPTYDDYMKKFISLNTYLSDEGEDPWVDFFVQHLEYFANPGYFMKYNKVL